MPFSGRVGGGGGPGPAEPTTKNRSIFEKVRGGPGGPLQKMCILEEYEGKAWEPEGSPSTKKTFFERVARGGPGGPLQKRPFW